LGSLLAIVGLKVTMEGIRTGTSMERCRERVPTFRGCNVKTMGTKEVRTKGADRKLVLESLKERLE